MPKAPNSGKAIVCRSPLKDGGWQIEDVYPREIGGHELLVRMVGSGICHTDVFLGDAKGGHGVFYPRVLGHEGSGYVVRVGADVTVAQPGDPVLLSFNSCGECAVCTSGHPSTCISAFQYNFAPVEGFSSSSEFNSATHKQKISGSFFGQSSFASLSTVRDRSVVNVKGLIDNEDDLKLLAPLGCGIQTGIGTIINAAKAGEQDEVVIMGLGGVGLSGVMGAKIKNCRIIIGIDRVESRLDLAKNIGATHVINTGRLTSLSEVEEDIKRITNGLGSTITMDTTGFLPLIEMSINFTRNHGKILQVGNNPGGGDLKIPIFPFIVSGKSFIGVSGGDIIPAEYVPKIIEWWKLGKVPMEKIVQFFKAEDFRKAIEGMHNGVIIKPVIVWE